MFSRFSPFLISFTLTSLLFINLCNWIFRCGCRSLWAGADVACNIHALHGPHCPWCSHGYAGHAVVMTLICAPQLFVALFAKWSWPVRTLAAAALFPAIGLLAALGFGWAEGYWIP
jgi:hypothetical protein